MGAPELSPRSATGWAARLALRCEATADGASRITHRVHQGPLRLLKPLHPEGPAVCHAVIVHPPGGIVGGDTLALDIAVAQGAHLVATTPGAQKWYRSLGPEASAETRLRIADGATLEWLPQEAIVFDAARAVQTLTIEVAPAGRFLGWEALSLGRAARNERFTRGLFRQRIEIVRAGAPIWRETLGVTEDDRLLASPLGFAGRTHSATAWVLWPARDAAETEAQLTAVRTALGALGAESALVWGASAPEPGLIVVKALADSIEAAQGLLMTVRDTLRAPVVHRPSQPLRLWST